MMRNRTGKHIRRVRLIGRRPKRYSYGRSTIKAKRARARVHRKSRIRHY